MVAFHLLFSCSISDYLRKISYHVAMMGMHNGYLFSHSLDEFMLKSITLNAMIVSS